MGIIVNKKVVQKFFLKNRIKQNIFILGKLHFELTKKISFFFFFPFPFFIFFFFNIIFSASRGINFTFWFGYKKKKSKIITCQVHRLNNIKPAEISPTFRNSK